MARRGRRGRGRRRGSSRKGILGKIPIIKNPTFQKAAIGVGTATLAISLLSLVAPGIAANPIIRPVLGFVGGGVPGVIATLLTSGGLGGLTNIFGGGGQQMAISGAA